jgi:uncharacterized protein (TIGR02246 family)
VAQDQATIEGMNAKMIDAFNKGDGAAVARFYTQKAAILPAGSPMVVGQDNIAKFWSDALQGVSDVKLQIAELQQLGSDAVQEIGRFSYNVKSEGGAQTAIGKYVVIWRKDGNDWKIGTDIWNADN